LNPLVPGLSSRTGSLLTDSVSGKCAPLSGRWARFVHVLAGIGAETPSLETARAVVGNRTVNPCVAVRIRGPEQGILNRRPSALRREVRRLRTLLRWNPGTSFFRHVGTPGMDGLHWTSPPRCGRVCQFMCQMAPWTAHLGRLSDPAKGRFSSSKQASDGYTMRRGATMARRLLIRRSWVRDPQGPPN